MTVRGGLVLFTALAVFGALAGCRGSVTRLYDDDLASQGAVDGGPTCPAGEVACGSLCTSTVSDPRHCGNCERSCNAGEVCGDGRCSASCPGGQSNCNGACADLQTESKNCGVCGNPCGENDECVEGKCVIACRTQLNQPLTDPWGWSWDGLERAASSFDNAVNTCAQFRGRVPTVSELHRVSATQSATVGQTIHTNPLWSLAPASPGRHLR